MIPCGAAEAEEDDAVVAELALVTVFDIVKDVTGSESNCEHDCVKCNGRYNTTHRLRLGLRLRRDLVPRRRRPRRRVGVAPPRRRRRGGRRRRRALR